MWRSLLCQSSCLDKPKLNQNQNTKQISKKNAQLCQYIPKSRGKGNMQKETRQHHFPKNPEKQEQWVRNVSKGLEGFQVSEQKTVCTNHFKNGKPTFASPASTLFLTLSDNSKYSPEKRKLPTCQQISQKVEVSVQSHQDSSVQCCIINPRSAGSMTFAQVTRERDVQLYNRNAIYCCLQVAF